MGEVRRCIRHAVQMDALPTPTLTARTPEQARLLLNAAYQTVLEPLMRGPHSAAEVARAARLDLRAAHHRLTRLYAAGLIVVEGQRQRGGRPIKVYRAGAAHYRVPFGLSDAEDIEALMHHIFDPGTEVYLGRVARHCGQRGVGGDLELHLNAHGQLNVNLGDALRGSQSGAFGTLNDRRLSPETARELERRLREVQGWVLDRAAEEEHRPDARPTLVGLLLATEPDPA